MAKSIYRNLDALIPVEKLLEEASHGLKETARTLRFHGIPEVLGAVVGAGLGGAGSLATLSAAGTVAGLSGPGIMSGLAAAGGVVGGGAAAGVAVLAAPVAVLAVAGYGLLSWRNAHKLKERKELLYQEALQKRDAVLQQLKNEARDNQERLEYLTAINIKLQEIIDNLSLDLRGAV